MCRWLGFDLPRPSRLLAKSGSGGPTSRAHSVPSCLAPGSTITGLSLAEGSGALVREKLVKIVVKVVRHGRYVTFQMAEVAVPRDLFQEILRLIDGLRRSLPVPA